jgi:hypothetical protein
MKTMKTKGVNKFTAATKLLLFCILLSFSLFFSSISFASRDEDLFMHEEKNKMVLFFSLPGLMNDCVRAQAEGNQDLLDYYYPPFESISTRVQNFVCEEEKKGQLFFYLRQLEEFCIQAIGKQYLLDCYYPIFESISNRLQDIINYDVSTNALSKGALISTLYDDLKMVAQLHQAHYSRAEGQQQAFLDCYPQLFVTIYNGLVELAPHFALLHARNVANEYNFVWAIDYLNKCGY